MEDSEGLMKDGDFCEEWKKPMKRMASIDAGSTASSEAADSCDRNTRSTNCMTALFAIPSANGQTSFNTSR